MKKRNKFKELSISMLFALIGSIVIAGLSANALSAYLFWETTYGEVIDYAITRDRPAYYTASQHTPELHEVFFIR